MSDIGERVIRTDIQMQAVARDSEIHLLFSEEDPSTKQLRAAYTTNFLLSPSDALVFSTTLADLAFEAEAGLKPVGPALKAELVDRHRATLIKRLEVILNSQREKKKVNNTQLARQLVEVCLSAVFS